MYMNTPFLLVQRYKQKRQQWCCRLLPMGPTKFLCPSSPEVHRLVRHYLHRSAEVPPFLGQTRVVCSFRYRNVKRLLQLSQGNFKSISRIPRYVNDKIRLHSFSGLTAAVRPPSRIYNSHPSQTQLANLLTSLLIASHVRSDNVVDPAARARHQTPLSSSPLATIPSRAANPNRENLFRRRAPAVPSNASRSSKEPRQTAVIAHHCSPSTVALDKLKAPATTHTTASTAETAFEKHSQRASCERTRQSGVFEGGTAPPRCTRDNREGGGRGGAYEDTTCTQISR